MKIISIVGARPNFMKVAPVHSALRDAGHDAMLIHTGQHYDANMSKVFFEQLGMPRPNQNLEVGSASHAVQTARIMEGFEKIVLEHNPELVLVAGDVNSTIACALVARKLDIPVAHLEAGLRSFDRAMPEEINRVLTDQISDILLTPSPDGDENLLREGISKERIFRVGNAMIDSLLAHRDRARKLETPQRFDVSPKGYALLTLHRPSNVDIRQTFESLLKVLAEISQSLPILFPIHPRTRARIKELELGHIVDKSPGLRLLEPLGYLEFLALQSDAKMVLTDSGGIQEETTALGIPCLTMRENTERPITITEGTNTLVGTNPDKILSEAHLILEHGGKVGKTPELWDGRTAERVASAVHKYFRSN